MILALATAVGSFALDEDLPLLREACHELGLATDVVAWDDPTVSWARFDAVLVRSTWNYMDDLPGFLAWCGRVECLSRLWNSPDVIRWNTDKRYLGDLAGRGVPAIESHFLAPGDDPARLPDLAEFVVKPTVSAGSRDTQRYRRADRAAAVAHARRLLDAGRDVLVQPYLAQVDSAGETALVFFDGEFSHAIRKAPMLRPGQAATNAVSTPGSVQPRTPGADELAVATQVLRALPFGPLPYARVDLLPSDSGPQLLELELAEPSLFLPYAPGAAARLAQGLVRRLATPR